MIDEFFELSDSEIANPLVVIEVKNLVSFIFWTIFPEEDQGSEVLSSRNVLCITSTSNNN
jgi:hypothetical protein